MKLDIVENYQDNQKKEVCQQKKMGIFILKQYKMP